MALVDANVLLDIVTNDPVWVDWSIMALAAAQATGPLLINDIVYAEVSTRFKDTHALDDFVLGSGLEHVAIPKEALFSAARVHIQYRRAGGLRTGVLPDFFIGAHAMTIDNPILTRDAGRYKTYFPSVSLIIPKMN